MITEKGTIITEFGDFYNLQKQLVKKPMIISIILLAVGSVGLAAYLIISFAFTWLYDQTPAWSEFLLLFALPFGLGVVFVPTLKARVKQSIKNTGRKNVYEFYSDCIIAKEISGGVTVATVRFDYAKIVKLKEIENYLFFCYEVKSLAYAIDKNTLDEKELATVKNLFKKDLEGAEVLTLPAYGSAEIGSVYTT